MAGNGIDGIPIRWPAKYDAAFFDELFRETLALGDVRNAVGGTGVDVTGTSDGPATISASAEVQALLTVPFVTLSADAGLQNERVLTAGSGITLLDGGPGGLLTIVAQGSSWGNLIGVPIYTEAPTPPVWEYTVNDVAVGSVGFAYANDDIAAGSLAGDLVLAPVAGRVFAASPLALDTDASLLLGGSAGTDGQSIVLSEGAAVSPSWLTAGTDDRVLRQTGGALNFGQLTAGMFPNTVVPDVALSANVPLLNATQTFTGVNTFRGIVYINPDPQTIPAAAINADSWLVIADDTSVSDTLLAFGSAHSLGRRHVSAGGTPASPTAVTVANTTYMGFIGGGGYDGTTWQTASAGLIGIRPVDTWSGTQRPTRVTIETTALTSTTRQAVASFDQAEIDLTATLLDFNGTLDVDGGNHDISTTGTFTISGTGETLATFVDDGAVTLYHNNTARVTTTSTGATVTGTTLRLSDAAGVEILFIDPDSGTNQKNIGWRNSGGQIRIISRDDAEAFVENFLSANVNTSAQWTTATFTCDDFVITASTEVEINAAMDFNGNMDLSGSLTLGTTLAMGTQSITTSGTLTIAGTGETLATFVDDGAVTLYFNNVATLATTATGVSVVGNIETAGTISITGTGETLATFVDDGAVTLFHNNTARIATSANGVDVTGILTATAQVRTGVYTVGTLPAGTQGDRALVTDALTPVFGAAVAAGGAAIVPVYYTGAAWFVG